jgi:hypothetical protein
MAREMIPTDVSQIPEVLHLAEEVARSGKPRLLKKDRDEIAVLSPVAPRATSRRRARRPGQPIPRTDSLFKIVGMASSEGPTDVSANADHYLAQAYYEELHPPKER